MTFEDARYEHNDFLVFIAFVDSEHEINSVSILKNIILVFLRILLLNIKI